MNQTDKNGTTQMNETDKNETSHANETETTMDKTGQTNTTANSVKIGTKPSFRRTTAKWILLAAFLIAAVLSILTSARISDDLPYRSPAGTGGKDAAVIPAPDHSEEIRRYNDAVDAALARHLGRIGKLADGFEESLRKNGPRRFDAPRAAIPGIRNSFAGFRAVSGIVSDGALDKAFGGDRLQNRFAAVLDGPFVRPCARAGQSLIADYETFAARLAAEDAAFREEIAAAHGKLPEAVLVEFPVERLRADMAKTYGALSAMPRKAGLVAVQTAIEAAFIRSTAKSIRNLALRFGGKAIGKGAVSAAAPVADGPFPFGDVIALGGAAWTAWDVYDLVGVLPDEIEKSLLGTVDALQTQTIGAIADAVRKTRADHEQAARSLAAAAWAEQGERQFASL